MYNSITITDASGFVALDKSNKAIVIAFRGSYSVRNWIADATFIYTDPGLCDGYFADLGFWSSWILVRDSIVEVVSQHPGCELVVVGHSLGAAVATLAAADIRDKGHSSKLYAYASPRVANPALARNITAQSGNYRSTHIDDPVPQTMTALYQAIEVKLWNKDILQLGESRSQELRTRSQVEGIMDAEMKLLEFLAFTGLVNDKIELNQDIRDQVYEQSRFSKMSDDIL